MNEIVHYLVLFIIQADSVVIKEVIVLTEPITLLDCLNMAQKIKESVAYYNSELNLWIMNNGSGTLFGHTCIQDPTKM
jgi:hypothetical protein